MKKRLAILLFLFPAFFSRAQTIAGKWQGLLKAGPQNLRLVFHINVDSAHAYQSSFDSPDQNAFGIPCSETNIKADSLEILIRAVNGGYRGKWDNKNQVSGYYFQNGQQFPMDLSRKKDSDAGFVRPQTPLPPFPYASEDLEYDDPGSGIHYSGTITHPKTGGPFPAAILITGSGLQDRDETIFGHKPFAVIADYLTRRGFAVLRVDDRSIGKSTGDVTQATSLDFAKDVETGIQELRKRQDIDRKRIGLIGHSEGGLIAAIAASGGSDINFIIMLAGPGLKGTELLAWQNMALARAKGEKEAMTEAVRKLNLLIFEAVIYSPDHSAQFDEAWKGFLLWRKNANPVIVLTLGLDNDEKSRKFLQTQISQLSTPWMAFFLKTDPADYISRLHCRVLALNGANDIQVVPDRNLAAIDSALKKSPSPGYETHKLEGLNHLFQHCKTCTVEEYGKLEETFAPEALEKMADWLDKNVK